MSSRLKKFLSVLLSILMCFGSVSVIGFAETIKPENIPKHVRNNIAVTVETDKKVYSGDEDIIFNVEVTNESSYKCENVVISMKYNWVKFDVAQGSDIFIEELEPGETAKIHFTASFVTAPKWFQRLLSMLEMILWFFRAISGRYAETIRSYINVEKNDYLFVFYKSFTAPRYEVSFDTDGGTEIAPVKVKKGEKLAVPAQPAKEGFIFDGWYTDADCTAAYDFGLPVTGDMTLYAKWNENLTPDLRTVSFESNGGSEISPQSVRVNTKAFRPADPIKTGYAFTAWYIDEELTIPFDFDNTVITDNITLYAGWTEVSVFVTIDTHDDEYEVTDVNRTFTVNVASENIVVTNVAYVLEGAVRVDSGVLGVGTGTFTVDVLLQDGENTFTVNATTADGSVISKSVVVTYEAGEVFDYDEVYDEGWSFDDYAAHGIILTPVVLSSDNPESVRFYCVANVLTLYFTDDSTNEERDAFIAEHNDLFEKKIGSLSEMDMIQVKLKAPFTDKETLTIDEYYDEILPEVEAYADWSETDILESVESEEYYNNIEASLTADGFVSSDAWEDGDDLWLKYTDADKAWEYDDYYNCDFINSDKLKLGVIDDGFHTEHEDLRDRFEKTYSNTPDTHDEEAYNSTNDPRYLDHGTHVAGIMAATANNDKGVAGVLHNNGKLIGADIFNADGGKTTSIIKKQLTNVVEAGAKVVNCSFGVYPIDGSGWTQKEMNSQGKKYSKYIGQLLEKNHDFIVVKAAGNDSTDYWNDGCFCCINYDNCYKTSLLSSPPKRVEKEEIINRIIVVSNILVADEMEGWLHPTSNGIADGDSGALHIIAAPGTNIRSTVNTAEYVEESGTSMAAPVVTAVCGLVWGINPELNGEQVVDLVMSNGKRDEDGNLIAARDAFPGGNNTTHGGMYIVNALNAVKAAVDTLDKYTGRVVNAVNAAGISAKIEVKNDKGQPVGCTEDGEIGVYYSNEDGTFTLPALPDGVYSFKVSAEGYVTYEIQHDSSSGHQLIFPLSPAQPEGVYQITLTWSASVGDRSIVPSDLDSHLVALTDTNSPVHVAYYAMCPSPGYANLDVDDTTYEGPEHITITNFEGLQNIRYAVHDYTNRSATSSTAISTSGVKVVVTKGDTELATFELSPGIEGTEWDVFAFDAAGNIVPLDRMKYCQSPENVLCG